MVSSQSLSTLLCWIRCSRPSSPPAPKPPPHERRENGKAPSVCGLSAPAHANHAGARFFVGSAIPSGRKHVRILAARRGYDAHRYRCDLVGGHRLLAAVLV